MILKRILVAELATLIVETRPVDLLDLRPVSDFLAGFIPYAMNLPESEPHFLVNLRKVWPRPRAVVLVATHSGISDEVVSAVHEVGGSVIGYVEFPHWKQAGYPVLTVEEVDIEEILHQQPTLVDVRRKSGHATVFLTPETFRCHSLRQSTTHGIAVRSTSHFVQASTVGQTALPRCVRRDWMFAILPMV